MKPIVYRLFVFSSLIAVLAAACSSAPASVATAAQPSNSLSSSSASAASTSAGSSSGTTATPLPNTGSSVSSGGAIVLSIVQGQSQAQYKVREQLANRPLPSDAVGVTKDISGNIAINPDGSIDPSQSKIVVDLNSLATDSRMRDRYVAGNILQIGQYPTVTFAPTSVSGLPSALPTSGTVTFKLTGNLTIRDVTKPTTWDVTLNINGSQATGTAVTSFKFEDFNLNQPSVPVVLSLVDNITLEADLTLQKAK